MTCLAWTDIFDIFVVVSMQCSGVLCGAFGWQKFRSIVGQTSVSHDYPCATISLGECEADTMSMSMGMGMGMVQEEEWDGVCLV